MNKRLVNMFCLNHRVAAYIPATIDVNVEIDNTAYVDHMAAIMSECFGGATSSPANGYWMSNSVGLVKEKTTIVFAYAADLAYDLHLGTELFSELSFDRRFKIFTLLNSAA